MQTAVLVQVLSICASVIVTTCAASSEAQADQFLHDVVKKVAAANGKLEGTVDDNTLKELYTHFKQSYAQSRKLSSAAQSSHTEEHFMKNVKNIIQHNAKVEGHESTFQLGLTPYTDISLNDFKKYYGGLSTSRPQQSFDNIQRSAGPSSNGFNFSQQRDWSDSFGPIENQMNCGSCYAYSALGVLECQYGIKNGRPISLSKQQVVDCCRDTMGCSGGWADVVLEFAKSGIATTDSKQYVGSEQQCERSDPAVYVDQIYRLRPNDFDELKSYLQRGAVSTVMCITQNSQHYRNGILSDDTCDQANHAVVTVSYGEENGKTYLKIRNSWGDHWGENGFLRMEVNDVNINKCGILSQSVFATIR